MVKTRRSFHSICDDRRRRVALLADANGASDADASSFSIFIEAMRQTQRLHENIPLLSWKQVKSDIEKKILV